VHRCVHKKCGPLPSLIVNLLTPPSFSSTCTALLRQSDANWEAYFIVTDDQPFDEELQAILNTYSDVRLKYLPLDMRFRPKVRAARMRAQ
jgi:hypothetical protein